jgi:hypothetical protein
MRPTLPRSVIALGGAILVAGCSSGPTAPLPREGVPDLLEVRVSGYGFGSHEVTLRADTLVIVRRQFFGPAVGADSARVRPDAAAWQRFWSAAREAGVARWPRACANDRVADGGGFTLRIVDGARSWEATGSNSYPRANGRCNGSPTSSPEYLRFLNAVAALIGRPYP